MAQTLRNGTKAAAGGKLNGAGMEAVTHEEMELSRLRAKNGTMHVEILKKRRRTLGRMHCKCAWIDGQRRDYSLSDMCSVLSVSISGYRAWR